MTFTVRNLSVLAYAKGFTLWHYASKTDTLSDVSATGFFDGAANMLTGGDMMLISAADGGRASFVRQESGRIRTVPLSRRGVGLTGRAARSPAHGAPGRPA